MCLLHRKAIIRQSEKDQTQLLPFCHEPGQKMGPKYFFMNQSLFYFPFLFYSPLPWSLLLFFTFRLKILAAPSRRTRHKSHQTRHKAQRAGAGHSKGSAGVLVTGSRGLTLGPEMQNVSSQPTLNLHLALYVLDKFCCLC